MIATANVGYFMKKTRDENEDSFLDPYDLRQDCIVEFFLFTTSVGVIIVMITVFMLITGLQEKINETQTVSL